MEIGMSSEDHALQHTLEQALLLRNRSAVQQILSEAHHTLSPLQIMDTLITPVLERLGAGWEQGHVALSQLYMSGRLFGEVVDNLFPLDQVQRQDAPRMAIAVLHDHHVLGKRIVSLVLRSLGYVLLDYGHGIEVNELVQRVREDQVRIVLISTLMFPSALLIRKVSEQIKAHDSAIQIVVGGAPFRFDDCLWQQVGADAMGRTASDAIGIIARVTQQLQAQGPSALP